MKYKNKGVTAKDFDEFWSEKEDDFDERLQQICDLCPKGKTIDLGGGGGVLAEKLGATVVDWSPVACEQARQKGLNAICANLIDFLDNCEEKYEVVVLADVLEEMMASETSRVLDGIKKICSKYFIISTPTHENYLNITTHQVIYDKDELERKINYRGFTKEEEEPYVDRLIARFVCK